MDLKSFADTIMRHVREYVQPAIDELADRIASIPAGKDGRDGVDGKDGEPGRDGIDGKDGTSVLAGDITSLIEPTIKEWFDRFTREAIASIPPPPRDGEPGRNGRDGVDGKSVTLEDVAPLMDTAISRAILDLERRGMDLIQRCIDRIEKPKDGKDGRDGADGLGFDDVEISHDGERTITVAVLRGERRKEQAFKFPIVIERGIWRDDGTYEKGDGVTFGGNYWIAQSDSPGKPGFGDGWRLAVRKGRDGRDVR
jgi:integrin beta 3